MSNESVMVISEEDALKTAKECGAYTVGDVTFDTAKDVQRFASIYYDRGRQDDAKDRDMFSSLEIGKGKVPVLMVDGILSMEQREAIKEAWRNAVANGAPFIMDKGMRLGSIKLMTE